MGLNKEALENILKLMKFLNIHNATLSLKDKVEILNVIKKEHKKLYNIKILGKYKKGK